MQVSGFFRQIIIYYDHLFSSNFNIHLSNLSVLSHNCASATYLEFQCQFLDHDIHDYVTCPERLVPCKF